MTFLEKVNAARNEKRIFSAAINFVLSIKAFIETRLHIRISFCKSSYTRKYFSHGRLDYQERNFDFKIKDGDKVLDIGSGPTPFKYATTLCDNHPEETIHRRGELVTQGYEFVKADVCALPFGDKSMDFVFTAHLLEHVKDPVKACKEIMRVGKRGYIETPNFTKDILGCQTEIMGHQWHTFFKGNTLYFVAFTEREKRGINSSAWLNTIWSPYYHPLQDSFINNQHLFNTMFYWENSFNVEIIQ